MRPLRELLEHLPEAATTGLSAAQIDESRRRFGRNTLTPPPREPAWHKLLAKFDEPIVLVLLAACLLSVFVDLLEPPFARSRVVAGTVGVAATAAAALAALMLGRSPWVPALLFLAAAGMSVVAGYEGRPSENGLAIMLAVLLATGVSFFSEYRSDREFELLNAHTTTARVRVRRDGVTVSVPLDDIVVGDQVLLEAGDELPADGWVVRATEFAVDQSLMTGESAPVRKVPPSVGAEPVEDQSFVYRGTQVVEGLGTVVVTEVGDATHLGQIARTLAETTESGEASRVRDRFRTSKELTPLQLKLERLAGLISRVGYAASVLIFIALVARGCITGSLRLTGVGASASEVWFANGARLLDYFMYMVIIIVVAVPEGLPMCVTVCLALAVRRMTRANSLVRQLVACETIGSATVICTDKTGTLTENRMRVVRVGFDGNVRNADSLKEVTSNRDGLAPPGATPLHHIALNAAVNSTANLEPAAGGPRPVGNPTESALLQWLAGHGVDYRDLRRRHEPVARLPFSSERKAMATAVRGPDTDVVLVKGAPDRLLERATRLATTSGTERTMATSDRAQFRAQLADAAGQAMRVLGFGYALLPRDRPADLPALEQAIEAGLVFVGFVAIQDALRDDVHEALAQCRRAGIDVKMVTGDGVDTARAVASAAGLLDVPGSVMDSNEFNAIPDEALRPRLGGLRVLARARPLDKYRLVGLLQQAGEVVAVTGDGTNDAPALRQADVGLAMGRSGTAVAREASKIVLLDDAFSTIVRAVHWGRALYENIQRFLQFQLTINASALVIAFLAPFLGVTPPFTILQLLWINVIMDTLAAIALCSEPPRPGLMKLPPKRRDENILTRPMLVNVGTTAGFFVVVMLGLLLGMRYGGWFDDDGPRSLAFPEFTYRQCTLFFTTFILFQVWNEINCRSLTPDVSGLNRLGQNRVFLSVVGVIVVLQVVIVQWAGRWFETRPLGMTDWVGVALGTSSVLFFREFMRRLTRRRQGAEVA